MKLQLQKVLLATVAGVSLLSGCAPLVVGGAVVGGLVAVDRRTSGTQLEDEAIELKVANAVNKELGERVHLNVTSYNRRVLLTGEVRNDADRSRATLLAQSQENVKDVVNDLAIGAPSSLSQRTKDTVTTGQVKAAFVDAKDLQASAVKVVTERGIVYLMGRVTAREAQRATDIARGISGVAKVVRVFEDISEEELKRLSQPPLTRAQAPSKKKATRGSLFCWIVPASAQTLD
ncbi:MAG: BON domain-containing protein, partial [Limnohabitans sp.]